MYKDLFQKYGNKYGFDWLLLAAMVNTVEAQLVVEITEGIKRRPIAIVPFAWEGNAPEVPTEVSSIIAADLERSARDEGLLVWPATLRLARLPILFRITLPEPASLQLRHQVAFSELVRISRRPSKS